MRLAVLSDIHGNAAALDAALADLQAQGGADRTWFLGDFAAFGPRPNESVLRVKALLDAVKDDEAKKSTVRVVRGNTDRYLIHGLRPKFPAATTADEWEKLRMDLREFNDRVLWCQQQLTFEAYEFLAKLPTECETFVEGYGNVIGYHGIPGDDESNALLKSASDEVGADALLDREGRLGIGGHTHIQMDRQLSIGGWRAVNVGSIGVPFDGNMGKAEYAIFTFENGEVQVDLRAVPYDIDAVIADSYAQENPASAWLESKLRGGS